MNRIEFESYIKSFNKQPGEFTKDEIYKIGVAHKSLPQVDKNWNNLADMLGYNRKGESLRSFIYKRQRASNFSENIESSSDDSVDNSYSKLYVEKQKIRDTYNAYRRNLRDEARIDVLKEFIEDCIRKIPDTFEYTDSYIFEDYDESESTEAVLMLSDLHIGVDCDNFYNKFNLDIACARMDKLCKDVIYYCRKNNVSRLNVFNLGDMIHGVIHVNARLEQQFDVIDQTIKASEILASFLNSIQAAAPEVIYRSVLDNHSRVVANKNEHIEKENLNRIID